MSQLTAPLLPAASPTPDAVAAHGPLSALPPSPEWHVTRVESIDGVERGEWDSLVPRDMPHLRWGFLAALERSGQCQRPYYLRVYHDDRLAAVAVVYHLSVDLLTLAPRRQTRHINAFRARFAPKMLYMGSLTCGPIVTNCRSNVFLSPDLDIEGRQTAAQRLVEATEALPAAPPLMLFFEFSDTEAVSWAPAFAEKGFLRGISLPGTQLEVRWKSLDGYTALMRKAFRRTVVKDRAAGESLEFEILNDFSAVADEAWALYKNVLDKADYVLQELTRDFFRELAKVDESRLVVARDRATGKMVGIELLLCGETILQDVFTGLDYSHNAEQKLYFNLLYPVIDFAGREGFRQISLGQTSYTFKARLGVSTYPLSIFVKHRNPVIQSILVALKSVLFTETATIAHRVFRADEAPE